MLTRFAYNSSYVKAGKVRHIAFMPWKGDGTTSVFKLGAANHAAKLQHAVLHGRPEPAIGYVEVLSANVTEVGLSIVENVPPPCHHYIGNWAHDIDALKNQAQLVAASAHFTPA